MPRTRAAGGENISRCAQRELAKEHLRILTAEPHIAGSPEDKKTAEYVLQKFKEAGLDAYIQEYKVWMNLPARHQG